jgi:hypothetical protein
VVGVLCCVASPAGAAWLSGTAVAAGVLRGGVATIGLATIAGFAVLITATRIERRRRTDAKDVTMTVEMLHTDGCPHAAEYLPRLRGLLLDAGFDVPISTRLMVSDDQAQQERFLGSPTIRINGRDVDPASADRRDYGLTCRLYAHPEGLRGAPPDEWVLAALQDMRS